jgi:hypothetical protein
VRKLVVDGGRRHTAGSGRKAEAEAGAGNPMSLAIRSHTTLRGATNSMRGSGERGNPHVAAAHGP